MLRMAKFDVQRPRTREEALALLAVHGAKAKVLAGGTDLVPNLKHRLFEPEVLIALSAVEDLRGIERRADGTLRIGAMTTLEEVERSEVVQRAAPGLADAARAVAGPTQRSMGTLGGNVCLDTRCVWYNQTYFWRKSLGFCMKKDGTVCHVVSTGKRCVAAASNDAGTMLVALNATLVLASARGERRLPIRDFYHADGAANLKLDADELLTAIEVGKLSARHHSGYRKLRTRQSVDFPRLSVAATYTLDARGRIEDAVLVLSAIAAVPRLVRGVLELANDREPSPEVFAAVAAHAEKVTHPLTNIDGDTEYRKEMVGVFVKRAFAGAVCVRE